MASSETSIKFTRIFILYCGIFVLAKSALSADFAKDVKNLASADPSVQGQAAFSLLQSSQAALSAIIDGLKDDNPNIRRQCARLLNDIKDERAAPGLAEALSTTTDGMTRETLVLVLARLKAIGLEETFRKVAREDKIVSVRLIAIEKVATSEKAAAIPFLNELLADVNGQIRLTAARELARLGNTEGKILALNSLNSDLRQERSLGTQILAYVGNDTDLKLLEKMRDDPKEHFIVKGDANVATRHIQYRKIPAADRLEYLRKSLADRHPIIRAWAAGELANRGDTASTALLTTAAQGGPATREARRALLGLSGK